MAKTVAEKLKKLISETGLAEYSSSVLRQLEEGAKPRLVRTVDGFTLMHYACKHGWLDFVKMLDQRYKCSLNDRTIQGLAPLHYACQYGHPEIAYYLVIDRRYNPDCCDETRQTPLHITFEWENCSKQKALEVVAFLITTAKCNVNKRDKNGYTAFMRACGRGDLKIAKMLFAQGHCDVTICNTSGDTAFHIACRHSKSDDVIRFLLDETSLDPNLKNKDGNNALGYASWNHKTRAVKLLVRHPKCDSLDTNSQGNTALHAACSQYTENDEVVKVLLKEARIDSNVKNEDGDTALHLACRSQNYKLAKLLLADPQCNPLETNNNGDTALHDACYYNALQISTLLLEETSIDPNAKNNHEQCPLDLARSKALIKELIRHGANPRNVYKTHGKILGKRKSKQPLQIPVKVFMVGNPSAGKSTLTKALQSEMTLFIRLVTRSKPVSGVDEKTAGIVPHEFESKTYGLVTLYDFAGQREFYSSHAAVLQNAIQTSTPIFVLVVDLSESNQDITKSILYWLSFLENQCTTVTNKPHVILIGSHVDGVTSEDDIKQKAEIIISQLQGPRFSSLVFTAFIPLNCQFADSLGMRQLHQVLKSNCDKIREHLSINFNAHCFLVYLLDKFEDEIAVTIQQIKDKIPIDSSAQVITSFFPQTTKSIGDVCDHLNDKGHLLVLKNPSVVEDSWVIINKLALLADVNGTIFAPEGFKEHIQLASSTGVVPLSNIAKYFSQYDLKMLIGFLSHLEFCNEILDSEVLELITQDQAATSASTASKISETQEERYFFFPGLVTVEVPSTVWEPQPQFSYHCGWILKCSQPEQFFDPRFLQVLLLRLAFSFAFAKVALEDNPALQRKCSIWKNGIYWGDGYGIETLVEVAEQNRVIILMRCPEVKTECLQLRSVLIQKVLAATHEFCSKVDTVESFINPSNITQYPLKPISELTLYDVTSVANAVAKCMPSVVDDTGKPVSLDTLLSFEAYAELGESILRQIFDKKSPKYEKAVSNVLIYDIAKHIPHKKEMVKKLFKPDPYQLAERISNASFMNDEHETIRILDIWKETNDSTLKCLREKLDQFSVFAGRNPLEIAGVPCHSGATVSQVKPTTAVSDANVTDDSSQSTDACTEATAAQAD